MTEDNLYYRPDPEQLERLRPYPINLECNSKEVMVDGEWTNSKLYVERIDEMTEERKSFVTRYNEAENFINEIIKMGFFERMIRLPKLCIKFLGKQSDKYKPF